MKNKFKTVTASRFFFFSNEAWIICYENNQVKLQKDTKDNYIQFHL